MGIRGGGRSGLALAADRYDLDRSNARYFSILTEEFLSGLVSSRFMGDSLAYPFGIYIGRMDLWRTLRVEDDLFATFFSFSSSPSRFFFPPAKVEKGRKSISLERGRDSCDLHREARQNEINERVSTRVTYALLRRKKVD